MFIDAYSRYNQIKMHTSFIIEQDLFCYKVMFFGRNMEVYVDDMLVKSKTANQHKPYLVEVFQVIGVFRCLDESSKENIRCRHSEGPFQLAKLSLFSITMYLSMSVSSI